MSKKNNCPFCFKDVQNFKKHVATFNHLINFFDNDFKCNEENIFFCFGSPTNELNQFLHLNIPNQYLKDRFLKIVTYARENNVSLKQSRDENFNKRREPYLGVYDETIDDLII
eukprot:Lithocolla_globosa_v1_NODE_30_length_9033_cov_22.154583.p7 type:complete len:113 gc:universal NODE_30_length_9033_cov_22.154583:1956-1618(-)